MKKTLAALTLLFLAPLASFAAETCSAKFIGSCKTFGQLPLNMSGAKTLRLPVMGDDSMIFNILADAKAKNHPVPSESAQKSAKALRTAYQAREVAKSLIVGDTDKNNLTAEQKALLARLDSVNIKVFKTSDPECKPREKSQRSVPEASYQEEKHLLVICPTVASLATPSFLQVIGHELGHSISACTMAKNLYHVKKNQVNDCLHSREEREIAKELLAGSEFVLVPPPAQLEKAENRVLKKLESCKLAENQVAANYSGKPEVYSKLTRCLDDRYRDVWKKFVKHANPHNLDPDAEHPDTLQCFGIYDEHFADAFGARVFAKVLETDPDPAQSARVAMATPASEVCADVGRPYEPTYPPSSERLLIQMSPANVQKALGCEMPKTKICGTDDFFTYPKAAAAPAEEAPISSGISAD